MFQAQQTSYGILGLSFAICFELFAQYMWQKFRLDHTRRPTSNLAGERTWVSSLARHISLLIRPDIPW